MLSRNSSRLLNPFQVRLFLVADVALKRHRHDFASKSYWEAYYKKYEKRSFEWFIPPETIIPYINKTILRQNEKKLAPSTSSKSNTKVLHLGAGLSYLGIELARQNTSADVVNVDSSQSAVTKMNDYLQSEREKPGMEYLKRCTYFRKDILCTGFENQSFDICLDKGTYDAVVRGGADKASTYLQEVHRLLKPGGSFVQISAEPPEMVGFGESDLWNRYSFEQVADEIDLDNDAFEYWIYYMKK